MLVVFVVYSFSLAIYTQASGTSADVHNASIGIVDEDRSALSGRIANAFLEPNFQRPELINADEVDQAMDHSRFMFVIDIPPRFEKDVVKGRPIAVQLNIDATAMGQAGIGAGYIQAIVQYEVNRFVTRSDEDTLMPVELVTRRAFNANGDPVSFASLIAIVNQVTMLTIILTGAALIREREHGTIEHLMVMPLTSLDIALAKVWANGLVILVAVVFAMQFVVRGALDVQITGSLGLFIGGVSVYLFFAATRLMAKISGTVYDQGLMTCHNAKTGEEVYSKRRFSPKGSFTASPWAYNGKIFCLSEQGLTYVVKAGDTFEILNTNSLDELCIATPSIADGKLLVRTLTKIYCVTNGPDTSTTAAERLTEQQVE